MRRTGDNVRRRTGDNVRRRADDSSVLLLDIERRTADGAIRVTKVNAKSMVDFGWLQSPSLLQNHQR